MAKPLAEEATAAGIRGIVAERAASGLAVLADANRAHARLRGPGERANAQLKSWRILRKLRRRPWRAGQLARAIHVLQTREIGG